MRCPELEIQMDEKRNDKPGRGAKPNRREDRKRDFSRREREDAPENMLEGRNAVTEALSAGRTIDKLFVADGDTDRALARICAMAKEAGAVAEARFHVGNRRTPGCDCHGCGA